MKPDYYNCDDCLLSEMNGNEAETHKDLTEHSVVTVYA